MTIRAQHTTSPQAAVLIVVKCDGWKPMRVRKAAQPSRIGRQYQHRGHRAALAR
jgi:hypothetical protein